MPGYCCRPQENRDKKDTPMAAFNGLAFMGCPAVIILLGDKGGWSLPVIGCWKCKHNLLKMNISPLVFCSSFPLPFYFCWFSTCEDEQRPAYWSLSLLAVMSHIICIESLQHEFREVLSHFHHFFILWLCLIFIVCPTVIFCRMYAIKHDQS